MEQGINLVATSKWARSSIWWLHPNGLGHQLGGYIHIIINLVSVSKFVSYIQIWPQFSGYIQICCRVLVIRHIFGHVYKFSNRPNIFQIGVVWQ